MAPKHFCICTISNHFILQNNVTTNSFQKITFHKQLIIIIIDKGTNLNYLLLTKINHTIFPLFFNSLIPSNIIIFYRKKVNLHTILMEIELKTIERLGLKNHLQIQNLPQEKIIITQKDQAINPQEEKLSFLDLFRFARTKEVVLMIFGTICASALGVSYPMFSFLWGNMIDSLVIIDNSSSNFAVNPSTLINPNIVDGTRKILIQFVYLGIGAFIVGWGMFASWMLAGSRLAAQCRKQYLSKLMEQEIQWFDRSNQSQLASKFSSDCASFQMAVSQKIAALITILSSFIAGLILAFFRGWMMTIAVLIIQPLVVLGWILLVRVTTNKNSIQQKAYSKASSKMEQAFSSIKTVKQLNGEEHEKAVYDDMLKSGVQSMKQYARKKGLVIGCSNFFLLLSYVTSFWYGSACIEGTAICPPHLNGGLTYTTGTVLTIFYSLILPALNLSQLFPSLQKIIEGRAAAFRIYSVIDRESRVQSPLKPLIPENFEGIFKFQRVSFAYPKDKTKNILNMFSCEINTANSGLVGKSGCGKSTVFQLMMRFYDPDSGSIFLDGNDLRDLDLGWLRGQIGYVGQEPVLFATSIRQNLRMSRPQATEEEMIVALKQAEAFDFVQKFPSGLQTYVGSGGSQVSGGQKQRLAIARALLKNPRILLLDEATSSLDRKNQQLIEETLNRISTTLQIITISHSATTIRRCQKIFVIEQGKLKEQGPYSLLRYYFDSHIKQKQFPKLSEGQKQINFTDNQQLVEFIVEAGQYKLQQNTINQIQQRILQNIQQKQNVLLRIISYGRGYKLEMIFGIIAAILVGCTFPVFSIYFGKILATELIFQINPSQSRSKINQYAYIQLGVIVVQILTVFFQHYLLSIVGTKITELIRSEVFLKILKMPVPWFQRKNNISGKLAIDIFTDFRNINNFASQILHSMLFIITSLCVGVITSLFYEWRIALVSLALLPLLGLSGFIQFFIFLGFRQGNNKSAMSVSSQIVNQAVSNIRTVLTLGEKVILQRYEKSLNSDYELMVKKSNIAGFFYGLSFMILFITIALIFYIASILTQQHHLVVQNVFPSIFIVLFVGITVGNAINYIPDTSAARDSANHIFSILDGEDQDQIQIKQHSELLKTPIKGRIAFQQVDFKYQSRTEMALSKVSFQIKEGEKVNFVGPSGCGKSTIMQLLIGFYQPLKGNIRIDGILLKNYDIHHLRSCFGIVSQQPILFNETIKYNIKYNHPTATDEEIVTAAKQSNYNPENERLTQSVSSSDGKGFDINVGIRGSHLSGGQKQRVAIARTILRNPHVLLLDEATSALDPTNEQILQDSLNRLMTGKTTINVTHKVNTIKEQQRILTFENGKIVEDMSRQKNVSVRENWLLP